MTNEFNEEEWRASAEGSPTFHFEKGEPKGKPDFEPDPAPDEEADDRAREWRAAEPPPRREDYRDHGYGSHGSHGSSDNRNQARNPDFADSTTFGGTKQAEIHTWAMLAHAAGAVAILVTGGILGWATPLAIWLLRGDEVDFASEQAKEALNFQITMFIYTVIAGILCLVLIGFPMLAVLLIVNVLWSIQGAMKTYQGEPYSYPWNLRLL